MDKKLDVDADDMRNRGWVRSEGGGEVCGNQSVKTMEIHFRNIKIVT